MRTFTALFFLALATLACSGANTPSPADIECALPPDANACETCLQATCEDECRACVDDTECYKCTDADELGQECVSNAKVGLLIGCVLGNCQDECTKEPSRKKRQRVGRGREGGGGGGGGGGKGGKSGKGGKNDH